MLLPSDLASELADAKETQSLLAGLLAAAFQHQPGHRGAQMEELLSAVLPLLPGGGRRVTRAFVVAADSAVAIQMVSALLLQMLQARHCQS